MALSPDREPVSWSCCCFFPHSEHTQTLGLPPIADIPHLKQERPFPVYNWMPVGGCSNSTFISCMALTWCICIAGFTTGEELINHIFPPAVGAVLAFCFPSRSNHCIMTPKPCLPNKVTNISFQKNTPTKQLSMRNGYEQRRKCEVMI